jgi:hypothetical protein
LCQIRSDFGEKLAKFALPKLPSHPTRAVIDVNRFGKWLKEV